MRKADFEPKLSIIITCLNRAQTIPETLAGIAEQDWSEPWEVLFADNGSTDASIDLFDTWAQEHPNIQARLVDASAERGKSFALNTAIAAARAPSVAFVDSDDVPGTGWLAAMGRALAVHPIVAARIDFARLNDGWLRESRGTFQSREVERLHVLPQFVHAAGGSLGVHRKVVDRVGGFDPDFAIEDTEFCVRAQLAGYGIEFVPDAVMHLRARDDLRALFWQTYNWGYYEMKLVGRYRDRVPFSGGWLNYSRSWWRLMRKHLRRGLIPRSHGMVNAALLREGAGRLSGQFAGMIRCRVPPPHNAAGWR